MDPLQDAVIVGLIKDIKNRCYNYDRDNINYLLIVENRLYLDIMAKHKEWFGQYKSHIRPSNIVKGFLNDKYDYMFMIEDKEN